MLFRTQFLRIGLTRCGILTTRFLSTSNLPQNPTLSNLGAIITISINKVAYPDLGRHYNTSIINVVKEANNPKTISVCNEASKSLELNPEIFHRNLALFFMRASDTMKKNYGDSFLNYAIAIRDGITKAIVFSDNRENVIKELITAYGKIRTSADGALIWNFSNFTARANHLYGLKEEGFLFFEDVKKLVERNNISGLNGEYKDITFQLVTQLEVRKLIALNQMSPLDAVSCAARLCKNKADKNILSNLFIKLEPFTREQVSNLGF